jgi:hypothetical protein
MEEFEVVVDKGRDDSFVSDFAGRSLSAVNDT